MLSPGHQGTMSMAIPPQSRPICVLAKENDIHVEEFWATNELLCSASPYFQAMLMGPYREANTSHVTIDQHPVWVVEAVLNFLKSGRLTSDQPDHDHSDVWWYRQLFELYHFADFYHVQDLRNRIVERVQKKLHYHVSPHDRLSTLTQHDFPNFQEFKFLCENVPESSPLRKVIADAVVNFNAQFSPIRVSAARLTGGPPARGRIVVPEAFKQDCDVSRSRQAQVIMCSNCAHGGMPEANGESD
ncbi:uncharacterized protein MYCFIDRAFT_84922 [Pseudocercospora fijiensis CIRAD86]|uniref:BTB domain-containing protein n=1 Tax=Pseudocercospora fijiensis (strain CIRAD86) TaxID=383855 RepID=M3AFA2_PSEFD|nr:uncharacterized protein MYCFIDRAFT_84922 [Pseudocercospora fijiensis CIRAD86]EME83256.1 hypothetical protein MYCFIDRAFT_84922 [Pseudocercospora fijiensis CIRAD86]